MAIIEVNGTRLFYEVSAARNETIVLVHGSWVDHHSWDSLLPFLASDFQILTYDRRGHSQSERSVAGKTQEDVFDLQSLIEQLCSPPVHVIGNSFGGSIVLKLAAVRPDLFKSISVHEPPLLGLLDPVIFSSPGPPIGAVLERIRLGDNRNAAIQFVETVALGPGAWSQLTGEVQEIFVSNATTFLDEQTDPEWMTMDVTRLAQFNRPLLFTKGDQSPAFFDAILQTLASNAKHAQQKIITGAGHIPHITHPEPYANAIRDFLLKS